jgi:6,7-dimethyl-8-ribityllumazine synthase
MKHSEYAIVTSRFNAPVTERLAAGARAALLECGIAADAIREYSVAGAWELVPAIAAALDTERFRAIVACGAVIRGETAHFDYICRAATDGLARLQLESRTPIGFAVLTADTPEQAFARADTKGGEAARAALGAADVIESLRG